MSTPLQAQNELLTVLDATQALIPGPWENQDSPSPVEALLPDLETRGVAFTGHRVLSAGVAEDAVAAVLELWQSKGLEAGRKTLGSFEEVLGVLPQNPACFVRLEYGAHSGDLSGQSAGVPGDVSEELERVRTELGLAD